MITNNENTWGEDSNDQAQGNGSTSFGTPDNGDTTNNYSSDDIADGDDDLVADDDLETDDLDTDDDLIADDDDLETDYEETNLDDTEGGGTTSGSYAGSAYGDATDPDEIPEEGESDSEGTGYSQQPEQGQQQSGADTSYSEQTDVTPPNQHEFPSTGTATQTDFSSRDHGRTTGRMVGHEPGTEGI
jgi:hypothetical protein